MAAVDTGSDTLLVDITDGVATVTMNRPEARNAMNREMMQTMGTAFVELEHNPDARCIVLTGAGNCPDGCRQRLLCRW